MPPPMTTARPAEGGRRRPGSKSRALMESLRRCSLKVSMAACSPCSRGGPVLPAVRVAESPAASHRHRWRHVWPARVHPGASPGRRPVPDARYGRPRCGGWAATSSPTLTREGTGDGGGTPLMRVSEAPGAVHPVPDDHTEHADEQRQARGVQRRLLRRHHHHRRCWSCTRRREPVSAPFGLLLPVFLTYVMSFVYLGIYWNNHHHMLHVARQVSGGVMWANLHLLFLALAGALRDRLDGREPLCVRAHGGLRRRCSLMPGIALLHPAADDHRRRGGGIGAGGRRRRRSSKGRISIVLYAVAIASVFLRAWIADGLQRPGGSACG